MAKIYASGNYVIVEDGGNLYEYAKGHTLYLLVDDIFYIKEITQGQYKVSVSDLEAGNITAEDSGDVYNVATFTTFLRENTGFKTAPGGSGAEWGSIRGTLSTQSDLQSALDSKQDDLVSGTNIKTINGNSVLGSGDLTISGGGGLQGLHNVIIPQTGQVVTNRFTGTSNSFNTYANNIIRLHPYISSHTITTTSLTMQVLTGQANALGRILIYSDLNSSANTKLYESASLNFATTGMKTATISFTFNAGTIYWIGFQNFLNPTSAAITSVLSNQLIPFLGTITSNSQFTGYETTIHAFGSAPTTMGTMTPTDQPMPLLLIKL